MRNRSGVKWRAPTSTTRRDGSAPTHCVRRRVCAISSVRWLQFPTSHLDPGARAGMPTRKGVAPQVEVVPRPSFSAFSRPPTHGHVRRRCPGCHRAFLLSNLASRLRVCAHRERGLSSIADARDVSRFVLRASWILDHRAIADNEFGACRSDTTIGPCVCPVRGRHRAWPRRRRRRGMQCTWKEEGGDNAPGIDVQQASVQCNEYRRIHISSKLNVALSFLRRSFLQPASCRSLESLTSSLHARRQHLRTALKLTRAQHLCPVPNNDCGPWTVGPAAAKSTHRRFHGAPIPSYSEPVGRR